MSRLRPRLSYANVVATLALFIALGGSATAALLITGKQVKNGTLTGVDLKDGSVGSADVKDGDLLARDFKAGELPAGPQGAKGDAGVQGPKGDGGSTGAPGAKGEPGLIGPPGADGADGSPDSAGQVLTKLLGVDGEGSGLDADLLGGLDASAFQRRGSMTVCPAGTSVTAMDVAGNVQCAAPQVPAQDPWSTALVVIEASSGMVAKTGMSVDGFRDDLGVVRLRGALVAKAGAVSFSCDDGTYVMTLAEEARPEQYSRFVVPNGTNWSIVEVSPDGGVDICMGSSSSGGLFLDGVAFRAAG